MVVNEKAANILNKATVKVLWKEKELVLLAGEHLN